MAKVSGPLFSVDASGGFASALVFGKWKGRNTVRQLVTPANPQSQDQQDSRNRVRAVGVAQHWANVTTLKGDSRTVTDKAALIALAPAGQAWNGFLSKSMIGAGDLNYSAAEAAWTALTSGNKTTWDTAAAALTPAFPQVYQADALGVAGTPLTAGQAFYYYQYGLYIAGVAAAPVAGTPPTYA